MDDSELYKLFDAASKAFRRIVEMGGELDNDEEEAEEKINEWLYKH